MDSKRVRIIQVLTFIFVAAVLIGSWRLEQLDERAASHLQFQTLSDQFAIRLGNYIKMRMAIAESLAQEMQADRVQTKEQFSQRATYLYSKFPDFQAINRISSSGQIDVVVPLEANQTALGHDLMTSERSGIFYRMMRADRKTTVTFPIKLFTGKMGFSVFVPVVKGASVGTSVVAIFDMEKLMQGCFSDQVLMDYGFVIRDSEMNLFSNVRADNQLENMESHTFTLPLRNRSWSCKIVRLNQPAEMSAFSWIIIVLSLIIAFVLAILGGRFFKGQQEIRERETRLRILLDAIPDAFFLFNKEKELVQFQPPRGWTCCPQINPKAGMTPNEVFPDDAADAISGALDTCFASAGPADALDPFELKLKNVDTWLDVEVRLVSYGEDILVMVRDDTRRKQVEKELKQSRERYRTIFEESQDVIFLNTPDGDIIEMNRAGIELFGATSLDQLRKVGSVGLYADAEEREALIIDLKEHGFVKNRRMKLQRLDGTPLTALISTRLVEEDPDEEPVLIGTLHDITEFESLQEQLIQSQKMESIGRLAGGIAHDFNNILSGVLGYASLMKSKISITHPFYEYVQTIERGALRASELTSRLLGFAKKGQFSKIPLKINTIVKDTAKLLESTIDKAIEIRLDLSDDIPRVDGDPSQFQQVIMNLCVNARDALQAGGQLTLKTYSEHISAGQDANGDNAIVPGEFVIVSVSDTGSGMDEETMKKIFEPFFTTKMDKGTGLGLSMVYGVVHNHGGFINVESHPGKGTTFRVYLPASTMDGRSRTEDLVEAELAPGEKGTILFVDDEEDNRSLAKEILEFRGIDVLLAADGFEAIQVFEENMDKIGGVILDMIMPKKSGAQVFRELRAMNPGVNVMVVSGFSEDGEIKELVNGHGLMFMRKPFKIDELVQNVRKLLAKSRQNGQA